MIPSAKIAAVGTSLGLAGLLLGAGLLSHPGATRTAVAAPATITYTHDIAPIVYGNCTTCHRAGEVAPFSLSDYEEVKRHAATMAAVTQSRYMPPWKAAPDGNKFVGERRLSDAQIQTVQKWVAEGEPEGDPADLPSMPHFPSGWRLGTPDAVVQPAAAYSLAADGRDVYRCFVLPTHYGADRYLSGIEVHPGNGRVVHHIILFLDTSGAARRLDARDPGPGYTSFGGPGFPPTGALGGWVPGTDPVLLPAGDGTLLPQGADIVMQIHYHKDGKPENDLTRVGLYFSKTPVDKRVRTIPVIDPFLYIPPGQSHYQAQAGVVLPEDAHLLDVMPHMHLVGHDMAVDATLPNGTVMPLVSVPDWDFSWQTRYIFRDPPAAPKGTKISLVAHYDNTAGNPRNPNTPPKTVRWGEQTTDEMCIAFVSYTLDAEHLTRGIAVDDKAAFGRSVRDGVLQALFTQFDTNGDGQLNVQELSHLIAAVQAQRVGTGRANPLLSADPQTLAQRAMMFLDSNGDGKLGTEELSGLIGLLRGRQGQASARP